MIRSLLEPEVLCGIEIKYEKRRSASGSLITIPRYQPHSSANNACNQSPAQPQVSRSLVAYHLPSGYNHQPAAERDGAQATTDNHHLNLALGMKSIIFFTSLELIEISPMLECNTIARPDVS